MQLSDLTHYAFEKYQITEAHKWADFPGISVLVEPKTGKWAALLMREWNSELGEMTEKCDLRCGQSALTPKRSSFLSLPARMHGANWLGVSFNEAAEADLVFQLFDKAINDLRRTLQGCTIVLEGGTAAKDRDTPLKRGTPVLSGGGPSVPQTPDIPAKIREMLRLYEYGDGSFLQKCKNFCRQGRLMADYTDDEPWEQPYHHYFPTYHDMNLRQLRGYFTWRTNLRKGLWLKAPLSFAYLYLYELLNGIGTDGDKYAEAALRMLPDDVPDADYNDWVCYLAMKGQEERMAKMAKHYFESGTYSENVLRYSYNELAGMASGGIYIANGDAAIIPKWLIQEGMGLSKDKTIVCAPFLAVKEYREWLNRKLNIVLPEWEEGGFDSYEAYERAMLQTIIDRFGSKVYFSATTYSKTMEPWKECLYNEGLLLKYSAKPYDNLAVKRRNVEERYQLEYLLVSFRPEWTAGQRLSANYAVLLADLLPYYAQHDRKRHDWLMRLLVTGVQNTSLNEEHKQGILAQLK